MNDSIKRKGIEWKLSIDRHEGGSGKVAKLLKIMITAENYIWSSSEPFGMSLTATDRVRGPLYLEPTLLAYSTLGLRTNHEIQNTFQAGATEAGKNFHQMGA